MLYLRFAFRYVGGSGCWNINSYRFIFSFSDTHAAIKVDSYQFLSEKN
jgi:hypothetical protein